MADQRKNPYESVTLSLLIKSFGETLGTLYPVAYVYDPNDALVAGAPFTLLPVANNLYVLNNAFQAQVDSGTFKVVYIVYEDAEHTIRSASHGEEHETITVALQSTTGGVGGGDGAFYDDQYLRNFIDNRIKPLAKMLEDLKKDFDAGLKVQMPIPAELSTAIKLLESISKKSNSSQLDKMIPELSAIKAMSQSLSLSQKNNFKDIINAIKKNRSEIKKSKFDKSQMLPVIESQANLELKTNESLKRLSIDIIKTIDLKNEEAAQKFSGILDRANNKMINALNEINESVWVKLKYTLDALKMLVLGGGQTKQNINITLKKSDE